MEPDVLLLWTNKLTPRCSLRDVISLCCAAYMPFLSCWLNPLSPSLSPDLISVSSPLLISFSLWFSCSFFFFFYHLHPIVFLSVFFPPSLPAYLSFLQLSKTLTLQYTQSLTDSKGRCSTGTLCLLSICQTNGKHSKCLGIPSFHW